MKAGSEPISGTTVALTTGTHVVTDAEVTNHGDQR